jgi:methionyl-tRNA formyltransferase
MPQILFGNNVRFVYFGTPEFAAIILDELETAGYLPTLIVTAPPKPKGRKLVLTPSEVEVWGKTHDIPVITPTTLKNEEIIPILQKEGAHLFVVAAYGKIIPKTILDIPSHGVINVHPSLLPKFRGSAPIESAILSNETRTGVTIMQLDEEMDHGPVIAQRERIIANWPPRGSELTRDLAHFGGKLLAEIIPEWLNGLKAFPQDHSRATFTKKISKEDGLIDLSGDPLLNYKKIRAYDEWPGAYFFLDRNGKQIRVKITNAEYRNGALTILRVIPEGKKEMSYEDFLRGAK